MNVRPPIFAWDCVSCLQKLSTLKCKRERVYRECARLDMSGSMGQQRARSSVPPVAPLPADCHRVSSRQCCAPCNMQPAVFELVSDW